MYNEEIAIQSEISIFKINRILSKYIKYSFQKEIDLQTVENELGYYFSELSKLREVVRFGSVFDNRKIERTISEAEVALARKEIFG